MPRPKKLRSPTQADLKRIDPTHPKTLGVKRMLDDDGLLQRSPLVDKFIISELSNTPKAEVEKRYVTPAFPHDPVDDPFKDWYKPFPLVSLCEQFKIPVSTFNRLRVSFFVTDSAGNDLHYPIMLGRTLWRAMTRLKLSSLREVVDYYNAKRAVINGNRKAIRKARRDDEDIDAEFANYQLQVEDLTGKLEKSSRDLAQAHATIAVAKKIIAKLRQRLTPEQQEKLDIALAKAGLTL